MLDTHQFFENLNEIQNKIYNSFFLKEVDRANLSPNEKAQLDIKIFEIACNNALRLQEMMQREKELEFNIYASNACLFFFWCAFLHDNLAVFRHGW